MYTHIPTDVADVLIVLLWIILHTVLFRNEILHIAIIYTLAQIDLCSEHFRQSTAKSND